MEKILIEICKFYNTDSRFVFRESRKMRVIYLRHLFFYLVKSTYREITYREIQEFCLNYKRFKVDHATILHAKKQIQNRIDTDADVRSDVQYLLMNIKDAHTKSIVISNVDLVSYCDIPRFINS